MATYGTGRIGKLIKNRNEIEEKQRRLVLKEENNNIRKNERKKVTFMEGKAEKDVRHKVGRLEEVRKELKEYIAEQLSELNKERRRCAKLTEEWRKKEKNWKIRIRFLKDKMEEVAREIKEIKEIMIERGREGDSEGSEAE